MSTSAAYGLRHVLAELHILLGVIVKNIEDGNQAAASTNIGTAVTNLTAVQTAINASTNATVTTATVTYTPYTATT